ncbi:S-protein homolog 5-like [Cornus florida]|uniref:S-protein homolog 5-like n=1 Tax=Cornus florida TaxID=4283 RepID=UPI00289CF864|nr:S-protein homolog 5-like [Cornus florida]
MSSSFAYYKQHHYLQKIIVIALLYIVLWEASIVSGKTTVRITNVLGFGTNLTIHCKSKNDDLGTHVIPSKAYYEWSFEPNFMLTTLYYCNMKWMNNDEFVDAYDANRDEKRCYGTCYVDVTRPQICIYGAEANDNTICVRHKFI